MQRRWEERIANQKEVIDRLMANRQKVLDELYRFESLNHANEVMIAHHEKIREALG
jgi:hypothetical protein